MIRSLRRYQTPYLRRLLGKSKWGQSCLMVQAVVGNTGEGDNFCAGSTLVCTPQLSFCQGTRNFHSTLHSLSSDGDIKHASHFLEIGEKYNLAQNDDIISEELEGQFENDLHTRTPTLPSSTSEDRVIFNNLLAKQIENSGDLNSLKSIFDQNWDRLDFPNKVTLLGAVGEKIHQNDLKNKRIGWIESLLQKLHHSYIFMEKRELLGLVKHLKHFNISFTGNPNLIYHLLETLKYHLTDLNLRNIMFLDRSLHIYSQYKESEKFLFLLPVLATQKMEQGFLSSLDDRELRLFFGFCVQQKVKGTYILVKELSQKDINNAEDAVSYLMNIADLPPFHARKFMIPPEEEVCVEILAKQCLSYLAQNMSRCSVSMLNSTIFKLSKGYVNGIEYLYHQEFLDQLCEKAVNECWCLTDHFNILKHQHSMYHINTLLVDNLLANLSQSPSIHNNNNVLYISMYTFISILSASNRITEDTRTRIKEDKFLNSMDSERNIPWTSKALELLNLNCLSDHVINVIFSEDFICKHILQEKSKKTQIARAIDLSLIKFRLNQLNTTDSPNNFKISLMIDAVLKAEVKTVAELTSVKILTEDLKEVLANDFGKAIPNVLYKGDVLIDYIIALDANGTPVEIRNKSTDEKFYLFEDFEIPQGCKVVCFINVRPRQVYRPNFIRGAVQVKKSALEHEGFKVIQVLQDRSDRLEKLHQDFVAVCEESAQF